MTEAEIDWISILIPSLIAGGITLAAIIGKKFNQTSEGTLSGTIKLEHVSAGLDNMEERMNKQFDKVEQHAEARDRDNASKFQKVYDKMDQMSSNIQINTYRIEDDRHRIDRLESRNGNGVNNHK